MKTKNIIITLIALLFNFSVAYSQSLRHKVKDGETIASIAKKYGISIETLKKKNPSLDLYFYSGMELIIPEKKPNKTNVQANNNVQTNNNVQANNNVNNNQIIFGNRTNPTTASTPPANESASSASTPEQRQNTTQTEQDETWTDYMAWYEKKFLSLKVTADLNDFTYMNYGIGVSFQKGGTSGGCMGVGIKKRILVSDILHIGAHVGPVIGFSNSVVTEIDDNGKAKDNSKMSFTYGLSAEIKAGIKITKTSAITAGYFMSAAKFKFDGFFKNGGWAVGITTGF